MADEQDKKDNFEIVEAQDGSATVDLPDGMMEAGPDDGQNDEVEAHADDQGGDDGDSGDDRHDDELRQARRNRRRAKKDLIRKTNQEKDARILAMQRETESMRLRLAQLERNTKAEHITRLDKNIEDAQVRLEYAKMKMAEATQNQDGQAMVDAQTLWQNANDEMRNLNAVRTRADHELRNSSQQQETPQIDPVVQRNAAQWMGRNKWYNPGGNDSDSRVAKKIDELMVTQGYDPHSEEYWEELDARLQIELPHRYNISNDGNSSHVRKPRNVVGSSGREAAATYGGVNRTQFVLSPDRVKAMKEAGAWDNPERKARMIKNFIDFDRSNGRSN